MQALHAMRAAGVETLRLQLVHMHATDHWIPSDGGRINEPYRRNLIRFVSDIRQAGFEQVTIQFNPRGPNEPAGWYTDDPGRISVYVHSRREASRLLDEAGWQMGADGYRYNAQGERLRLTLMTTAGNKVREIVEVYLQDQWGGIGIDVRIQNEPARIFFGETTRKRLFDGAVMYAWTSSPESAPRSTLHSESIPSEANGWSGQNQPGWIKPEVDALIEALEIEFDPARRKELAHLILAHYTSDVPVIPLYYRSEISVTPANLAGYSLTGHQVLDTNHVERWHLEPVAGSKAGAR